MVYAEGRVHRLINEERRRRGLPQLGWDEEAHEEAKEHSCEMADECRLFHSPPGSIYYECCWGGEGKIPYGEKLARMIVKGWMGSREGHREILLSKAVKYMGVGIWRSESGVYATARFRGRVTNKVGCGVGLLAFFLLLPSPLLLLRLLLPS